MCIRFASRCRSRSVRPARALILAGSFSFLLPVILPLSPDAAAAQVTAVAAHPYAGHVAEAAQRFGIPEAWIWAVMRAESNGDPGAVSRVGAMGLMQLMPGTWAALTARYGLGGNPWDARANIHAGAAYLREMLERDMEDFGFFDVDGPGPRRRRARLRPRAAGRTHRVSREDRANGGHVRRRCARRPARGFTCPNRSGPAVLAQCNALRAARR